MNTCHNNPKKSLTTNINKHTASGYLLMQQKISLIITEAKIV